MKPSNTIPLRGSPLSEHTLRRVAEMAGEVAAPLDTQTEGKSGPLGNPKFESAPLALNTARGNTTAVVTDATKNHPKVCFPLAHLTLNGKATKKALRVGQHIASPARFTMKPRWARTIARRVTQRCLDDVIEGMWEVECNRRGIDMPHFQGQEDRREWMQWASSAYETQNLLTPSAQASVTNTLNNVHNFLMGGEYTSKSFVGSYFNLPTSCDATVSLLEDTTIFVTQILLSSSQMERYIAYVGFCKARGARPGFAQMALFVLSNSLGARLARQFRKDPLRKEVLDRVNYETQNDEEENPFARLRSYLAVFDRLKESAIYKKVYESFIYLLANDLLGGVTFESANFSKFEARGYRESHKPGATMLHTLLDTLLFICEKGMYYFKTGDSQVIFHSGKAYEAWMVKAQKVVREANYLADPEPHNIDIHTHAAMVDSLIEKGQAIMKFSSNMDKFEKTLFSKLLYELENVRSERIVHATAQQMRKDPFGVLIHGSSGICKSQLRQILFYAYGKRYNHPTEARFMYTRNPLEEYWSGFTTSQWCISLDDVAFLKPGGEIDPTLKELLMVKNNTPYTPPQAEAHLKGRTPIRPELVIATTNTRNLNLVSYFACPFAVARRLPYIITPKVKPQFAREGGMADSSKIPETREGELMDIWTFKIVRPYPSGSGDSQGTEYAEVAELGNIRELLEWFGRTADAHNLSQERAMKADAAMSAASVCATCRNLRCTCPRMEVQMDTIASRLAHGAIPAPARRRPTRPQPPPESPDDPQVPEHDPYEDETVEEPFDPLEGTTNWFRIRMWYYKRVTEGVQNAPIYTLSETWRREACCASWVLWYYGSLWGCLIIGLVSLTHLAYMYAWVLLQFDAQRRYGVFWRQRLFFEMTGSEVQAQRMCVRIVGERIKRMHFANPSLLQVAKGVGIILGAYTTYCYLTRTKKGEEQGLVGSKVVEVEKERPTFYYSEPYRMSPTALSAQSRTHQGTTLQERLEGNVARLVLHGSLGSSRTTATCVEGQVWLVNAHSVRACGEVATIDILREAQGPNVTRNQSGMRVSPHDFVFLPDTDLCGVVLTGHTPGKRITEYFAHELLRGKLRGIYVMRSAGGESHLRPVANITVAKCKVFNTVGYHAFASPATQKGDCGSPLLCDVGTAAVILGIHTTGDPSTGGCTIQKVLRCEVEAIVRHFGKQVAQADVVPISAPGYERMLRGVDPRAPLRWLPTGTATVYGNFVGFRPRAKSRVIPTLIADSARELGYTTPFHPPDMSWRPWSIALSDMVRAKACIGRHRATVCSNHYTLDVLRRAPHTTLRQLERYTLDVALNGAEGVTYVDRINIHTSAGVPLRGRKSDHFILDANNHVADLQPVLKERIRYFEQQYAKGERAHPQFCAHLKDEPVSASKRESGKTRVFAAAEVAFSIVMRQNCLSLCRFMQNSPKACEAMVGVVAQSREWDDLYTDLTVFGTNRIIAGDYRAFDKEMEASIILEAFAHICRLYTAAGASEEHVDTIRCIGHDVAFFCVDFDTLLVELAGNPSGHALTVIINCIVGSIYMRLAWLEIYGEDRLDEFSSGVVLRTYGDDNIMGVHKDYPEFNHTAIVAALATMGITYTMADKGAVSVPYIDIGEATFLKRSFRHDSVLGAVVGPLDESSIAKMLTMRVADPLMCPEAHAVSVLDTALREYFYYGKEVFARKKLDFILLVRRHGLEAYLMDSTFPAYESLAQDFETRSRALGCPGKTIPIDTESDYLVPINLVSNQEEGSNVREHVARGELLREEAPGVPTVKGTYTTQSEEGLVTFITADIDADNGHNAGNNVFSTGDSTNGIDLGAWLERPVLLHSGAWSENDTYGTEINNAFVWSDLLGQIDVRPKLANHSWFRGDLHLRIQFSVSPFFAGRLLVTYQPLTAFKASTIVVDATYKKHMVLLSQRPHVELVAGGADTVDFVLPFMYPANYVNLQKTVDVNTLGKLSYTVLSQLRSANGATGVSVKYSTYGWIENLELSGASVGYAMQADEYGEGCISQPASMLARAANYFEHIPVIGPFATATRIGASAVSAIASMFGFTNVPVIADTQPFRNTPYPQLSTSEIGYPVEKLTLDPKNELSIDPRIVGLADGVDEMQLAHFCGRESLLTTTLWDTADASGYLLMYTRINPQMFSISADTHPLLYGTPMSHVAAAFTAWRGTIIFRFVIVKTQYHRGKLQITYDPSGYNARNIGNTTAGTGVAFSTIVDLGETDEVEVAVPYQQATQFLTLRGTHIGNVNYATRTAFPGVSPYDPNYDNGLLTVRVLTEVTGPLALATVDVLVYVRAGKDIEFANPCDVRDISAEPSFYAPQSDTVTLAGTGAPAEGQYAVHFGENVRSLRQLLRRYQYHGTDSFVGPTTGNTGYFAKGYYKMPTSPGYTTAGTISANKIVGAGTFNYNFVTMTSLSWFANAFLAYRGSTMWTHNVDAGSTCSSLRVYKDQYAFGTTGTATAFYPNTRGRIAQGGSARNAGGSGSSLTNQNAQAGVNVTAPNYSRFKFQSTDVGNANVGSTVDGSGQDYFVLQGDFPPNTTDTVGRTGIVSSYVSIGTDFGLYAFLNIPTVYLYTATPTAA